MANEPDLEFNCPQYVDFAAELNSSGTDDVFFDCKDHRSPEDETKLIEKMTAALSVIENTPKFKVNIVKGKHLAAAFSNNLCPKSVNPAVKANTVSATGLHKSKSIARLNKIITDDQNKLRGGLRKRSSSLSDLRTYKKQTYATTPMCLKRTIVKTKGKVIKSTEEMELEEIAKLQKQLIQHLRHNEMTLKRLKLKPKPCIVSKHTRAKTENFKGNKGLNPAMEKLNATEKKQRRNVHTLNHVTIKNEAMKIEDIIKGPIAACKPTDKGLKSDKKSKQPSTSSGIEVHEKSIVQATKRPVTNRKIGFHSGLVFHDNVKKNTTVQPFSFDAKIREKIMSSGSEQKTEVSYSNSTLKYKVDDGKENIPCDKLQSTLRKTKEMRNTKCDIVKQLATNRKAVDKYIRNPMRGMPLSDNFARN